jgi:hypothetical protein
MTTAIEVVARTWKRDTHSLFDYEGASSIEAQSFNLRDSSKLVRVGDEVMIIPDHEDVPEGAEKLLRIKRSINGFSVEKWPSRSSDLWQSLHDCDGHELREGDVIKVGRFKMKVRQLASSTSAAVLDLGSSSTGDVCCVTNSAARDSELESSPCRICLLEGSSGNEDPLIAPCNCKGTIEYVHLSCLRHWVKTRVGEPSASGAFVYKAPCCELCKSEFSSMIKIDDCEATSLAELPPVEPPFVVLECRTGSSARGAVHVVPLKDKPLKIGRGHGSDIRIADVSLSREHALICLDQDKFTLSDGSSKFGTLVKAKDLHLSKPISFQIGRTLFSISPLQLS